MFFCVYIDLLNTVDFYLFVSKSIL